MGITSKSPVGATRSPLNFPALRVAGQSIDESMDDLIYDGAFAPAMFALMMALMASLDWARYFLNVKPSPWLFTLAAVGGIVYASIRIRATHKRLRQLKLGREGERAVAQFLDQFIVGEDTFAFHDVPNEGANIDHVVVSPRGVFTIETKTLSKPVRGDARIRIEGDAITANGFHIDRNPIVQAKGQARWLSTFLAGARMRTFVQPVIVFPGWFVEPFDMHRAGVWVLEPKAIDRFIANESNRTRRKRSRQWPPHCAATFGAKQSRSLDQAGRWGTEPAVRTKPRPRRHWFMTRMVKPAPGAICGNLN